MQRLIELGASYRESRLPLGVEQLFPEELAQVRLACDKRLRDFAAGRCCARQALEPFGLGQALLLGGETGAPVWPQGMVGSITHTEGFAAASVASERLLAGIGIDAEWRRPGRIEQGMLPLLFTEAERTRFGLCPKKPLSFLGFAAKEALYKCLHPLVRTFFGFTDAELLAVDMERSTFTLRLLRDLPAGHAAGRCYAGMFQWQEELILTAVALLAPAAAARRSAG
ncbi:MAG: 4'-phosphopantetheinyl transferase superfamily protein [Deltaproteobacteria bacterium]|nr:4'-phosphopantetheinyl transferase superfamily protein [Deltaproteobacteria bacterium]